MAESTIVAASSSKRVKRSLPQETHELTKLQLDSEKTLYEIQCFAEELFASRKSSQTGPSVNSFIDPVVNLNIDLLLSRINAITSEAGNRPLPNTHGGLEALLNKLISENEDLKRKESASNANDRLSKKKDIVICDLKKEAAKSRAWINDLQEQNDRLSSQLFMFQMQQNAYMQQRNNSGAAPQDDYPRGNDQYVKSESSSSPP